MEKEIKKEGEKKFSSKTIAISVAGLVVAGMLVFGGAVYFVRPHSGGVLDRIMSGFPRPAAIVDGTNVVYASTVDENLSALRKFYENQDFSKVGMRVDFSTEDGEKRLRIKEKEVFNKAIEDKVIEILAKERGIKIEKADVDRIVSEKLAELGTENDINDNLKKIYGWDLEQFKNRIVMPSLYSEKLKEEVLKEIGTDQEAKALIEKAKKELDGGKDFSEVMRTYSQGVVEDEETSGWIAKNQLLPELADKIFSVDSSVKKDNEVIESQLGYHIIRVEENKKENGVDMVRIKQIFARKKTFGDWLSQQMSGMGVNILLRDYQWNKQDSVVEFKDQGMRDFEKKMYENLDGDISVMF